ncbi:sulfotransferase [Ideonella sp.]|uniref:sulfotransferase n=1 Tax=Ideonella sp. TaxID=1929293 RepID=UPI003BB65F63
MVLGAINTAKGYEVLRRVAACPASAELGLSFSLLGYSQDDDALREAGVQVLGRYDDASLGRRLRALAPDLVFIPSIWPETYCYALSEPMRQGLALAAFDLGAPAARLRQAGQTARLLPLALADQPDALAAALAGPVTAPNSPFFIIGSVRSGTTWLRDLLRSHPNLACPEETHFYRWAEPFGSPEFRRQLQSATLQKHRKIDGIPESEFQRLLALARSRAELMRWYAARFLTEQGLGERRWFDKTPQNIYGAAMMATDFAEARFIHLVRHPLDVVASLREGKVLKLDRVVDACAYWNEAMQLANALARACPNRVLTLRYEDLLTQPIPSLTRLLQFIDEPAPATWLAQIPEPQSPPSRRHLLTPDEQEQVMAWSAACLQTEDGAYTLDTVP